MRIGIDIMGGDYAPLATAEGALLCLKEISAEVELVLIGDRESILTHISSKNGDPEAFDIIHTSEVIGMGENPSKAFTQRSDSSIVVGFRMLQQGMIEGFASAGNTGAMLVGSSYMIKTVPGLIRPAIATVIPSVDGPGNILLDAGINPDCRPDVLYQYGILGSIYAQYIYGVKKPRVGLLNIGAEDSKGNLVTRSANELMKGSNDFHFIGNVEGNDLFSNKKADVVVCDGFVGNVVIKEAEAIYSIVCKRGIEDAFFKKFNYENYGGTPVLGINANVVIGHGISSSLAIKNMILHTISVVDAGLSNKIKEVFK